MLVSQQRNVASRYSGKMKLIPLGGEDHCIDAMREMIMCRGDMTPIPVIWDERGQRDNPYFPIVHSCRNFDKLRGWMLERHDLH